MPSIEQCRVNVFTHQQQGGNPALIVFSDEKLPLAVMQDLARNSGCPETVFLLPQQPGQISIAYLTPNGSEMTLCIHGTLGAIYQQLANQAINTKLVLSAQQQEGLMLGEYDGQYCQMTYQPFFTSTKVDASYQSKISACFPGSDHQHAMIASAGSPKLLIQFADKETLFALMPDFDQIIDLSKALKANGIYAYVLSSDDPSVIYARAFNPLFGINEDIATGSAAIALAKYLYHSGKIAVQQLTVHQGDVMAAPSRIYVDIIDDKQVKVKGAVSLLES